jgi:protein-S-isoprenylcysteine O-methyltransferase Ste14
MGAHMEEEEMHLIDEIVLGIGILLLLGVLVIVKQVATGSVLDKPKGNLLVQLVNIFNLFFLLIVNPLAAVALITHSLTGLDPTHIPLGASWLLTTIEIVGLVLYVSGFFLMVWALLTLGRNYQLGGSAPRAQDKMVMDGPYGLVRHPMYTAALIISLGLALLIQSLAFLCVFFIYLVLILKLIPMEEQELERVYGAQYAAYQHKTRMLVPSVY